MKPCAAHWVFPFGSNIDVVYAPGRAVSTIVLAIGDVTEGEVGGGFPTAVGIRLEDDSRYETSATGCSATVTEHELENTEMSEIGELRNYGVVGTASCTEPALRSDGTSGQISLANVAFRIPAVWRD